MLTKTNRNIFLWVVVNGLFSVLLYTGVVGGSVGALNVSIFMCWVLFALTLVALFLNKYVTFNRQFSDVPLEIDRIFDFCVVIFLVWHGWIFTGIAYLAHRFILDILYSDEERNEQKS